MVAPADALRYQRAGSQPKTIRWYAAGHGLNGQAYRDQAEWLRKAIGIASRRAAFPLGVRVVLIAWFLLTAGSLAFVALILWRTRARRAAPACCGCWRPPSSGRWGWSSTGSLAARRETRGNPSSQHLQPAAPSVQRPGPRAAISAASSSCWGWCSAFCRCSENSPLLLIATLALAPFCVGWLIFAASRGISRSDDRFSTAYHRPVLAELVSACLVLAGAYPTLIALIIRFLGPWTGPLIFDLTYAPLWGGLSLACLAGALVTYPFHLWMIRRGVIRWGG